MEKIRIGILGYGNLGKGVEQCISQFGDMELVAVFTRREAFKSLSGVKVENVSALESYKDKIDVLLLCGGSATDLPEQAPYAISHFNIVDSFDTHEIIPEYFNNINALGVKHNNLGLVATGWDPGVFSLARVLFLSVLPKASEYTFWGDGVSQGHSDALRRIEGVKDAVQYTLPKKAALDAVRQGKAPQFKTSEKHLRRCFIVLEKDCAKLKKEVENTVINMPAYFKDNDVEINFVSQQVLDAEHKALPHGGFVLASDKREIAGGGEVNQIMELSLKLDSNPEFTASVMLAYARAVHRLRKEGKVGALSVFDVAFGYLSEKTAEELRATML
ncbi:MAG: diaminopimelate dehydrogenase [Firmicutes bacterium]|nr:diaminopimelate dehydrogenase [Bacillota bacterium]